MLKYFDGKYYWKSRNPDIQLGGLKPSSRQVQVPGLVNNECLFFC